MAKTAKNKGTAPRRNPSKRVMLSPLESKELLTRTRIRDRVRDLLSRSAIRYKKSPPPQDGANPPASGGMSVTAPQPHYHLNLGKRTLLMLQAWKKPQRVIPIRTGPVNRFYVSILISIGLIGASGSYTYHVASRWYERTSRQDFATIVNWEGWVRKVSGKSQTYTPSRTRSDLLAQEAERAERRALEKKPSKRKTVARSKPISKREPALVQQTKQVPPSRSTTLPAKKSIPAEKDGKTKVAHKRKRSPFDEMRAWMRKRTPDVESVRVTD